MKRTVKKLLFAFSLGLACVAAGSYVYLKYAQTDSGIHSFNYARDAKFILDIFKDPENWYWLIAEGTEFSPEKMLKEKGYPPESTNRGNLFIRVGYEGDKPTGFVVYYMQSFFVGRLLFIFVDKEFRSKRWGRRLLDYAVKELKKMGAVRVELITRTNNEAAQRLYTRYGFKEVHRYGAGFVDFSYDTTR